MVSLVLWVSINPAGSVSGIMETAFVEEPEV